MALANRGTTGSQPGAETAVRLGDPFVCVRVCMGRVRIWVQLLDGPGWTGCLSPGIHRRVSGGLFVQVPANGTRILHTGQNGCLNLEASTLYIFVHISHLRIFILISQREEQDEVTGAISVYVSTEWVCLY